MEFIQILTLSIVQGITEFLPISSSAHLVLVPVFAHWGDQGFLFDIGVHVGTLLAVMLYFRCEVKSLFTGTFQLMCGNVSTVQAKLALMLIFSTLPLVLVGPFVKDWVSIFARSLPIIAGTSIGYGVLLYWADKRVEKCSTEAKEMTAKHALIYGLFQALAVVPGTSRSGICMTAGRLLGFSRVDASRYAMLMSIPIILLIGGYSGLGYVLDPVEALGKPSELLMGVFLTFIAAYASIHLLMKFVEKVGFLPFVIYRLVLGFLLIGYIFIA
tara:strand:+ start:18601 stop:19413 length:813 start_codon:yes stop_codon:yes gene_type:complete